VPNQPELLQNANIIKLFAEIRCSSLGPGGDGWRSSRRVIGSAIRTRVSGGSGAPGAGGVRPNSGQVGEFEPDRPVAGWSSAREPEFVGRVLTFTGVRIWPGSRSAWIWRGPARRLSTAGIVVGEDMVVVS
jgi:hypothetical protein